MTDFIRPKEELPQQQGNNFPWRREEACDYLVSACMGLRGEDSQERNGSLINFQSAYLNCKVQPHEMNKRQVEKQRFLLVLSCREMSRQYSKDNFFDTGTVCKMTARSSVS